jgi:2-polyprenyl-6-methoxyphenol hydroxylase-like FAD-dependent oxidoreductase
VAAQQTEVLICGAGPTGLALAVELGSRGIRCVVVERNANVGNSPRAKTTHTRTREHMRRWGIADKLASFAPFGIDYPSTVHFVTRLSGHSLATFENAFNCSPARNDLYAEHAQWIPQYRVEQVLLSHAASLPTVRVLFEHEFLSAKQNENGVRCLIRDHKGDFELAVECSYLVGADGPRSSIRDAIGAKMEGRYGLSFGYNIIFRAPGLSQLHKHGPGIMYWQINSEVPSLIGPMDKDDLWYFMPAKVPDLARLDKASAADLIRRATGIDLPYEVLSADEWAASEFIASKYRDRRIFLIGDACHLHPPTGGYGMNMGISDSVDLGWKMAAVLQGWGGHALLDSYEQERRPVHRRVIDAALSNFSTLALHQVTSPEFEADSAQGAALRKPVGNALAERRQQEFRSLGVMLGYTYDASPITAREAGTVPDFDPSMRNYVPSARPGARAPHAWVMDGHSLYDLFGQGFTLLHFGGVSRAELQQAKLDAETLHMPLQLVHIGDPRIAALYERNLALIRPDQHVAWRGDAWPGAAILKLASGHSDCQAQ